MNDLSVAPADPLLMQPTSYPDRAAWLAARRHGLGSSDAGAVLGVSPWRSPFAVYVEKLGLDLDEDHAAGDHLRWGLALEPLIAERYVEDTTRQLLAPQPWTIHTCAERPWQIASLDRVILPSADAPASGPGVLEIKTTAYAKADEWLTEPPLTYQVQMQHHLAVTGWAWGSFAVLVGGQRFFWLDVMRDDAFIATLIEHEARFWARVLSQTPPDIDGSDAAKAAIHALRPREVPGLTVALPPEADVWDSQRQEAASQIEHWKAKQQQAENALKALIGEAEVGLLPTGASYRWAVQARKAYSVAASSTRVLRRKTA